MNFEESLSILDTAIFDKINRHLKDIEVIILEGSWHSLSYEEIANKEGYAANYLRQDVGFKLWKLLSEVLEEEVNKTNFRAAVGRLVNRYQVIASCNNTNIISQEISKFDSQQATDFNINKLTLEYPEGSVPINSLFYLQRQIDIVCYEKILQPGALIRIKAPHQMGKTSLCDRIIAHSKQEGYSTVRVNLLQAEATVFSSLDRFLRWFCACISHKLKLSAFSHEYWDECRGSIINCTTYLEENILTTIDRSLVLALDEVDIIFQYPEISQGFFAMLRSWHEEAKTIDIWENLRLVVVNSTENYGSLDINQSPFNIGLVAELEEFTPEEIENLAQRHNYDCNSNQIQQLISLIGGHPYLVRLALYHIALGEKTLDKLLEDAPTNAGIYEAYLRRILKNILANEKLTTGFMKVVNADEPVAVETMQAYQLYSMGLVKRVGDKLVPRCQLYRKYFREHLKQ
ncbi:MAG: serine/threonine protein kinase [Richelia sp. RM1_1_1]|nr:serine/threonine protein kinase [Richelia sp. SM1_7_0]NJN11550.1 serine/threonine protein kinase [Richelia sp. RM1_1_1]